MGPKHIGFLTVPTFMRAKRALNRKTRPITTIKMTLARNIRRHNYYFKGLEIFLVLRNFPLHLPSAVRGEDVYFLFKFHIGLI